MNWQTKKKNLCGKNGRNFPRLCCKLKTIQQFDTKVTGIFKITVYTKRIASSASVAPGARINACYFSLGSFFSINQPFENASLWDCSKQEVIIKKQHAKKATLSDGSQLCISLTLIQTWLWRYQSHILYAAELLQEAKQFVSTGIHLFFQGNQITPTITHNINSTYWPSVLHCLIVQMNFPLVWWKLLEILTLKCMQVIVIVELQLIAIGTMFSFKHHHTHTHRRNQSRNNKQQRPHFNQL